MTTQNIEFSNQDRIKKIEPSQEPVSFEQWREIIKVNFPELLFAAEVGLAIIAQLLINDVTNPFALVLVDVPSSGKTITINFFSEIEGLTYATDKFTPASFVSSAANVAKDKLKDIDLLPRIRYKLFLIRDLSTLFSKRDDDLSECLGLLTRVLDGEGLNTDSGIHGQRQYVGEYLFMILAASTPIPPRVMKMMGSLGSRLFFLNINSRDKSEKELADQLTSTAYKQKELVCRTATKSFLQTLWSQNQLGINWDKSQDNMECNLIIARCAMLLARLRGVVQVWKDQSLDGSDFGHNMPVKEKADRISQQFYNLCRSHAVVCGRRQVTEEDLRLIIELAIDSAPTMRAKLLRKLIEFKGTMMTSEVEVALDCSKPTALKEMEILRALNVCKVTQTSTGLVGEPEKAITLSEDFIWFLSDECNRIRGRVVPVEPKPDTVSETLN